MSGNIAMLPSGRIPTDFGNTEAYLIEGRSISGFSGAPVFVPQNIVLPAQSSESGYDVNPRAFGDIFLLGVMHGHWTLPATAFADPLPTTARQDEVEVANAGIAIVVPATKILGLFDSESFQIAKRAHLSAEWERRLGVSPG